MRSQKASEDLLLEDDLTLQAEDEVTALPDTDLSSTVGAFETRFQKKQKQQAELESQEEKKAKKRHNVLLEAMMNIRRSLAKVARINLGEDFCFEMSVDDWQGWPKIVINLRQRHVEGGDFPYFQVTAIDRQNSAVIDVIYGKPEDREKIPLSESNIQRLPNILKKCVRSFLETVEDTILNFEHSDEGEALKEDDLEHFNEEGEASADENAIDDDLYIDDNIEQDILDKLPTLDTVEALPDTD